MQNHLNSKLNFFLIKLKEIIMHTVAIKPLRQKHSFPQVGLILFFALSKSAVMALLAQNKAALDHFRHVLMVYLSLTRNYLLC